MDIEKLIEKLKAENSVYVFGASESLNPNSPECAIANELEKHEITVYPLIYKDANGMTLPLTTITYHVRKFLIRATTVKDSIFHVAEFGTGMDGYSVEVMATLFAETFRCKNVVLPEKYVKFLTTRPVFKVIPPEATEFYVGADAILDHEEFEIVMSQIVSAQANTDYTEFPSKIEFTYNGRIEAKVFYE